MRGSLGWCSLVMVLIAGCGGSVSLRWQPTGRASQVDDAGRALLSRMITAEPTDDAVAAREEIWELRGSPGDDDVRALLASSVRWIDALHRGGQLERLRSGGCSPSEQAAKQDGADVIGMLEDDLDEATAAEPPRSWARLGLDLAWSEPDLADASCERAYRALRALAVTRAWLGANVDDAGVLETFQEAVERVRGPVTQACEGTEDDEIARAIVRHLFELDPLPFVGDGSRACLRVTTLGGPFSDAASDGSWVFHVGAASPYVPGHWVQGEGVREGEDARVVEALQMGWHGGPMSMFVVARRGGTWRVIDYAYAGEACR